jgi:hypothetical protein
VTAAALVAECRGRGIALTVAEPDGLRVRPASVTPPELLVEIRTHKPVLLQILRRAAVFREQAETWSTSGRPGVPLLVLPSAPEPQVNACISCGILIPPARWRCDVCLQAFELALEPDR